MKVEASTHWAANLSTLDSWSAKEDSVKLQMQRRFLLPQTRLLGTVLPHSSVLLKSVSPEAVMNVRTLGAGALAALLCIPLSGCGSRVKGNTYEAGLIVVSFQSGGKATFGTAGDSAPCTYSESGDKITLTCNGDTTIFTVDSDGSLDGPPGSLIPKLVKRK
jgi:hypothetical protein